MLRKLVDRLRHGPTAAWLRSSGRSQPGDPRLATWDNRYALIERLAPGRSFLDLGGMFSIAGEVAFRAEEAGATRVVLFDGMDPSQEFILKYEERGSGVEYVQGDLHDPEDIRRLGEFDVVWCAGVVYHSPNPYQQLYHLRKVTREQLLLGTHVIPEIPGIENGCIFYPGQSEDAQRAFTDAHGPDAGRYPGMTRPFAEDALLGYGNMWWGLSPSAVRSMLRYAGFTVEQEFAYHWSSRDFLAKPGPAPDFIPPLGLSRARGEERMASHGPSPSDWWPERERGSTRS
jgi:Protein of unknown function (DUF1698)